VGLDTIGADGRRVAQASATARSSSIGRGDVGDGVEAALDGDVTV
jgi:hypothetical protein